MLLIKVLDPEVLDLQWLFGQSDCELHAGSARGWQLTCFAMMRFLALDSSKLTDYPLRAFWLWNCHEAR